MSGRSTLWKRLRGLLGSNPSEQTTAAEPVKSRKSSSQTPVDSKSARPAAANEAATTAPAPPSRVSVIARPVVDLVIGVDFGTSCTKVAVGDPGWQNESFAVPFSAPNGNIDAWLRPTRFENEFNLKMRLMDNPVCPDARALAACYLADILRHSRSWFAANCPAIYRKREHRWSLNVGFPEKSITHSPLTVAYRDVTAMAVALASSEEPLTTERAHRIGSNKKPMDGGTIPANRINLYPEIAAQLAGYFNSPYWKPGNLLLVDVGAGTLDVSTMILGAGPQEEKISFHFCEVAPLGVLRLYQSRMAALDRVVPGSALHPLELFQDGSRPIPDDLCGHVRNPSPELNESFERTSADFAQNVVGVALRCLARFRKAQRKAHMSAAYEPWGRNLRFFLTGGGCRSTFYRSHLAEGPLEDRLAAVFTCWRPERADRKSAGEGLLLERLPIPDRFSGFPETLRHQFDRLSVAHGLAMGSENLMCITNRHEP